MGRVQTLPIDNNDRPEIQMQTVQLNGAVNVRIDWFRKPFGQRGVERLVSLTALKNTKLGREFYFRLNKTDGMWNAIGRRGAYDRATNTYTVEVLQVLPDDYQFPISEASR